MRLKEILKIRPDETLLVALLTALMFATTAGAAIGSPGIEALFFSRIGVQFLPHMYLALGLVIAATSLAITALLGRVDLNRLYVGLPLVMAGLLIAARFLIALDLNWFYPPLWLGMNVAWTLLNLFIWGLAAIACDTRQAKRLFPLFGAGSILGLAGGGLVTKPLVEWLGTENLLLVWSTTLVLAFFIAQAITRTQGGARRISRRRATPAFERVKQGYEFTRRSGLIRWMAIAAVLFAVLYYSVVFPFSKAVTAEFAREDDLAAFLGVFQGASMGTAFLASLLLSNRLYARFGFMTMIFAYPVLYFLGFSTLLVSAAFPLLVAFRFAQLVWSEGVSEGANQAMYNLVPSEQREQTRAFVRGVANPAGVSLVGAVLLLSETILPPRSILVMGVLAAAVTAYLVWQARGAYGQALLEALRAGRPQLFFTEEEPFGGFRRDASAVEAVIEGISSPEVAVRRVSAEILGNLAVPDAVDAMVAALDDQDPAVRAAVLRSIARAGAIGAILEVLSTLEDLDPQVRLEAVRALRQLARYPQGLIKYLQPLLHDPDATVRSQAAASLLSFGSHAHAEEVLIDLARNGKVSDRVEALKALSTWGSQSAYELAEKSLKDHHPAVRAAAATALARIDASQCTFTLVGLLGDEDQSVRQSAARALGEIGRPSLEPVLAALSDQKLEDGALLALKGLPLAGAHGQVLSYVQKRRERALHYHGLWLASRAVHNAGERLQLVQDALRNRALQHGTNALKAIALLDESAGMGLAIENLDSRDPGQRANALEMIESMGKNELVRPLLALWEAEARPAVPAGDWLEQVMQDEDAWLRACAALAARDRPEPANRAWLARLAESDPDELVRATARASLNGDTGMRTLQTLSLMERILFLRRVPLFLDLTPSDLKQIAVIAGEHLFATGDVISEQGEMGEEMFIIVSGEVRVMTQGTDGTEVEIARRGAGEYVGEMSIISREPRMASLTASGEVRVLCIEQADFEELLRLRPETSLAVMRVLCERLRERELGEAG